MFKHRFICFYLFAWHKRKLGRQVPQQQNKLSGDFSYTNLEMPFGNFKVCLDAIDWCDWLYKDANQHKSRTRQICKDLDLDPKEPVNPLFQLEFEQQ